MFRRRILLVSFLGVLSAACAEQPAPSEPIAMRPPDPRPPVAAQPMPPVSAAKPAATGPLVSVAKPSPPKSPCQGRSALSCRAWPGCAWTSGYTTGAGKSVSSYCRVSTAKAPSTATASRAVRLTSNCHWVRGYTRKNGTRVAGYQRCRR